MAGGWRGRFSRIAAFVALTVPSIAAALPAARAEAAATFAMLARSYSQIEQRLDILPGDLGGAAAAFVAGCYVAMHGVDFPDRHFGALVAQRRQVMATVPGFEAAPARERRGAYEQLAIVGMLIAEVARIERAASDASLFFRDALDPPRSDFNVLASVPQLRLDSGHPGLASFWLPRLKLADRSNPALAQII
jgi:hypothetical protein